MLILCRKQCFRISSKILKPESLIRSVVLNSRSQTPELNNDHVFKKIWTKHELIDHLRSRVYYEDDNYVVVNKPYGILARINRAKQVDFKGEGIACDSALLDILPDLSTHFNAANLDLVVHPQWLFSGVTIFSKCNRGQNDLPKDFQKLNVQNRSFSYLAIVLGNILPEFENSYRISSKYEIVENKKTPPKSFVISYKHSVLGSSKNASLVKVDLDYNYVQLVRLVLATKCFSPVLGDFNYSKRVATLFDVPLLVPPREQSETEKKLPQEILEVLQLTPEDIDCCPCHVHLYSTIFRVKNTKFVTAVPPPEYFVWTCEQLGLKEVERFFRGAPDFKKS